LVTKSHAGRRNYIRAIGSLLTPKTISCSGPEGDRSYALSPRKQLMGAGVAALLLAGNGLAAASLVNGFQQDRQDASGEAELARMERELAATRAQLASLSTAVEARAERLESRHQFLASLVAGDASPQLLAAAQPIEDKAGATGRAGQGEALASVLAPLEELESAQLAFVDQATVAARARLEETQALVRTLGIDPSRLVRQTSVAMGGPLENVEAIQSSNGEVEPRFNDLFISWKKLDLLERAVNSIPSAMPAKQFTYTSGFGARVDPFTSSAAQHAGVDMAGRAGEPIYAAADGVVGRAGRAGAYGNMIEVQHGSGIATRYAHLSRVRVRPGDRIRRGELIGHMGSTGRSTGSHLHYEVRIDGRAVDPMPFLKKGGALLALQERGLSVARGGPSEDDRQP
jgi:murein DD-endopeptidase MepM/ murein hydrolase activator NlpD